MWIPAAGICWLLRPERDELGQETKQCHEKCPPMCFMSLCSFIVRMRHLVWVRWGSWAWFLWEYGFEEWARSPRPLACMATLSRCSCLSEMPDSVKRRVLPRLASHGILLPYFLSNIVAPHHPAAPQSPHPLRKRQSESDSPMGR